MEYIDMFSFPIFQENIELDNQKILEFCLSQEKNNLGRVKSNSGGWQSDAFEIPSHELAELFDIILDRSKAICDFMDMEYVTLGDGWININKYKDFNWTHMHPFSLLSGVYYVKTPKNCGDIEFENPDADKFLDTKRYVKNFNKFNSPLYLTPSEQGVLYIFPSWIKHKVFPNMNKTEERVSISFNLK